MAFKGTPDKRYSKAWAICDRTGTRFPMSEMIKEPGTGYLIHYSVSDGMWNMVDHPQANLQKWAQLSGDPYPVPNARPDINWAADYSIQSSDNTDLVDINGTTIDLGKEDPLV